MDAFLVAELAKYHPLKGAIFARDWLAEARETQDPAWRAECMCEYQKYLEYLRAAYAV